jgi:hypothetical protein
LLRRGPGRKQRQRFNRDRRAGQIAPANFWVAAQIGNDSAGHFGHHAVEGEGRIRFSQERLDAVQAFQET